MLCSTHGIIDARSSCPAVFFLFKMCLATLFCLIAGSGGKMSLFKFLFRVVFTCKCCNLFGSFVKSFFLLHFVLHNSIICTYVIDSFVTIFRVAKIVDNKF